MLVKELMTASPATVTPDDHLGAAANRLWDHDCGALPVVDGSGAVVGMLTDRDICMATWTRATSPELIPVKDAMSMKLVSCGPDHEVEAAVATMRSSQVRRLPVVDAEQQLVGVLSLADVAKAAHADPGPLGVSVVNALAVICQRAGLLNEASSQSSDRPSLAAE